MSTARVKWVEDKTYLGIDVNGRSAVMSAGGDGPGVSPMQMLLLGLGGCTMYDVVNILQKQRQDLTNLEIEIAGERADEPPKPWQTIHLHYVVSGRNLDPSKVERAIDLSVEKYCGAHATLSGVATITHDYAIREEGTGD
ncbi:MAG: OsmC family protein [Caldilineaceae bacterium]